MREIRPSGSEGGARSIPCPYPYLWQGQDAPLGDYTARNPFSSKLLHG
jgi:hypothetical protein